MKEIILKPKECKIYVDDLPKGCAILVKNHKGNVIGTITQIDSNYMCGFINHNWDLFDNISQSINYFGDDSKFYLLE